MGNELSQHVEQSKKTGVLQLRNFKLTQVNFILIKWPNMFKKFTLQIKKNKVPNEILPITQFLRNLDLSNNKIKQLPNQLFIKTQLLKTLNLSNNKIELLPNEISLLAKLETLNLSENLLVQLPNSLGSLKNLKQINLSKNNFRCIPKELAQIQQLDHLDLSSNKIERVEDYVENLSCIEINLNENQVKYLSANIAKCQRLKVIKFKI